MFKRTSKKIEFRYLLGGYNWYSAPHKYLRFRLFDLIKTIALTNFDDFQVSTVLPLVFNDFKKLLEGHAQHEEKAYHSLLTGREELKEAETEHKDLDDELNTLDKKLRKIFSYNDPDQQITAGAKFHLKYTSFVSRYMNHLVQEETVLMPLMRKIHGVDKLRQVTFGTYHHMTKQQMVGMLDHLCPHLNFAEKITLLLDIKDSDLYHQKNELSYEAKYPYVWQEIIKKEGILTKNEIDSLQRSELSCESAVSALQI